MEVCKIIESLIILKAEVMIKFVEKKLSIDPYILKDKIILEIGCGVSFDQCWFFIRVE